LNEFLTRYNVKPDDLIKVLDKLTNRYAINSNKVKLETDVLHFLEIFEIKNEFFEYVYRNIMSKDMFSIFLDNTKHLYSKEDQLNIIQNNVHNLKFFWYGLEYLNLKNAFKNGFINGWYDVKIEPYDVSKISNKDHKKWLNKELQMIFIFSQENVIKDLEDLTLGYFLLIRGDFKFKLQKSSITDWKANYESYLRDEAYSLKF